MGLSVKRASNQALTLFRQNISVMACCGDA